MPRAATLYAVLTAIAKSERRAGMLGRYGAAMEHTVSLQTAR